ncbi:hypothetical protein HBI13_059920 [Parastagonospora nodorum]|nr:hypothetical protein HBI10_090900 [Parastagonospora nodorum]KAH4027494.1 hypothetical protein HBI13_059920 [Parastagonospora nodorum]
MAIQKKKRQRMTPNIARKRQQLARPSHFLSLPAELRNKIYEFVLSATSDLLVKMVRGTSRRSKKPRLTDYDTPEQEFNQIKFVNRQLYAETAGMEVSFNRIRCGIQVGVKSYRPIHRFRQFVKECAPGKWKWLRHIVLGPPFSPKDEDVFGWMYNNRHHVIALINLCIANPHLTLHLHIPGWPDYMSGPHNAYRLVFMGAVFERLFRDRDLTDMIPESKDRTLDEIDSSYIYPLLKGDVEQVKTLGPLAPNLRFHPIAFVIDEEQFRQEAFASWQHYAIDPQVLPHDAIDNWVRYVRKWFLEGI